MKKKSASSEFAKYVSQNVFAMIGMSCYILADTFFISKAVGANCITVIQFNICHRLNDRRRLCNTICNS